MSLVTKPSETLKLSFVIPTFNSGSNLERIVKSILALTDVPTFEIVIVDNNSTDGSIDSILPDERIRIIRESRQGAASARNRGMVEARGEILAFVDSDIQLDPRWARECLKDLEKPWVDCVQTPIEPVGPESFMTRYRRAVIAAKTEGRFSHLIHAREALPIVNSSAFMLKREVLTRTGCRYDADLVRCEDLDFSLQLFAGGCHFSLIETSRAYVTDDRTLTRYLVRSFRNGMYTDLVRRLWRFPLTRGSSGKKRGGGVLASIDRSVTRAGLLFGFLAKSESHIERRIKSDPRVISVDSRKLHSKDRLICLPEAVVLIELSRGSRSSVELGMN